MYICEAFYDGVAIRLVCDKSVPRTWCVAMDTKRCVEHADSLGSSRILQEELYDVFPPVLALTMSFAI